VPVSRRSPSPPSTLCSASASEMALKKASQVPIRPARVTAWERSGSYRERIDACVMASAAPRLAGCRSFPSILIGRPMVLSASTPRAMPRNGAAVAKNRDPPGTWFSGWRMYGTITSSGWRAQARPPSANEAPISLRKLRRPTASVQVSACSGNSWRR